MKTQKFVFVLAGICLLFFVSSLAMAEGTPSAKFDATWTTSPMAEAVVVINDAEADVVDLDLNWGLTFATIKVPQAKELLVGVSAEIGLVTDTSVKGKNGAHASALAGAGVKVVIAAVPRDGGPIAIAQPGPITLSKRIQELDATLGGVIESCEVTCTTECDDQGCATTCDDINIAEDCIVTDEEIGLLLDTTAAHHFNFVLPNMEQGVYDIVAFFITGAKYDVDVDICDDYEGATCVDPVVSSASAYASAIINKTMLTVQELRAVKNDDEAYFTIE